MKLWLVAQFFSLPFGIGEHTKHCTISFLYSSTRNDMLKSEWKKGATSQSFIRKEITSYRIGTLIPHLCVSDWHNLVSLLVYIEAGRSTTSTTLTFTTASTSGITWKAKVTQIECYRWVLSIPFLKSNYFKEQHSTFSYLR